MRACNKPNGSKYLAAVLVFSACSRFPDSYPAPEQYKPLLKPSITMIAMDDPEADDYIVRDISPAAKGISWRWSYDRPEIAVSVKRTSDLKAAMDFSIVADTFRVTGPVTVALSVNGRPAIAREYRAPGDYHLEAPVPDGAIASRGTAHIAADVHPTWTAPQDGKHLGVVLVRMGLL